MKKSQSNSRSIGARLKPAIKNFLNNACGRGDILEKKLAVKYTDGEVKVAVRDYKKRQLYAYMMVVLVIFILAIISVVSSAVKSEEVTEISRKIYGDGALSIPLEVDAEYEGKSISGTANISLQSRELTDDEIKELLKKAADALPDTVIPRDEKSGRRLVTGSLELPEKYTVGAYDVDISWSTDMPDVISAEGLVDVTALTDDESEVTLEAEISYGEESEYVSFAVEVARDESLYVISLQNRIKNIVSELSKDRDSVLIRLPAKTDDGIILTWRTYTSSSLLAVMIIGGFILLAIYMKRYDRATAAVKRYRAEVISAFPSVMDKLILLINSGLTVQNALMKIMQDKGADGSALGGELARIQTRVKNTNSNIIKEWKELAMRMESADMIRFCSIVEENVSKGITLTEKLEAESENLRDFRRKDIQKRIRLIDSKMMIPMMIMFSSLIIITVVPAMAGF